MSRGCFGLCGDSRSPTPVPAPRDDRDGAQRAAASSAQAGWTLGQKIGAALLVTTLVLWVLAALFGADLFNSTLHVSTCHLTSGSMAGFSAITLVAGAILYWKPCEAPQQKDRPSAAA